MFADEKRLVAVLEKIDALELPADASLAAFAKQWRERAIGGSSGWDLVGWHVWNSYIKPSLPKFLYFDDYSLLCGKVNLESLASRQANNGLTDADETTLGLFDLAGTSLDELTSDEGYENSKAKLEAIGLTITDQVFHFWRQNMDLSVEFDIKSDAQDSAPFNNGKNLYIRVRNAKHGVTVPFDQRSKGFIWFFSFMVWFSAIEKRVRTDNNLVLLLDEPGLNLHALAQADLLAYIAELSKAHQIVYSTHSPFMVDSANLSSARVVEDIPKLGTRISSEIEGSSEESVFPLQAALGYSIAQNLFISKRNVLVEGPADLILLQHMSSIMEESGRTGLDPECVIVPVGGLDKLATFVALLGANKLKLAIVHDWTGKPHQKLDDMVRNKLIEKKRVLDFSMFRQPSHQETDIEGLFPRELYLEAFNSAYAAELNGKLPAIAELGEHPRILECINQWLAANEIELRKDGGFNHYRVAKELLARLSHTTMSEDDMARFEALFTKLNKVLD